MRGLQTDIEQLEKPLYDVEVVKMDEENGLNKNGLQGLLSSASRSDGLLCVGYFTVTVTIRVRVDSRLSHPITTLPVGRDATSSRIDRFILSFSRSWTLDSSP